MASAEPDWILEQTLEMHRRDLEATEKEFEEKLEKARKRERQMKEIEHARARKRQVASVYRIIKNMTDHISRKYLIRPRRMKRRMT
jgi:septal ring factor EnvC (AmiA/AmiB activator)